MPLTTRDSAGRPYSVGSTGGSVTAGGRSGCFLGHREPVWPDGRGHAWFEAHRRHTRPAHPDAVLAPEIDERVAAALRAYLGMMPGDPLPGIFEDDVVLGAPADAERLPLQVVLGMQRIAAINQDLHVRCPL